MQAAGEPRIMTQLDLTQIAVITPNLKRRLSGVTTTVVRLIPIQARLIGITTTGPGLPPELPHITITQCLTLPRDRWRVWHARRRTWRRIRPSAISVLRRACQTRQRSRGRVRH